MRKKSKKRKKAFALEIIDRLKKAYPDSDCTLDYNEAWKLLVSVRLAAQCTDARVNVIVQDLYAEYPTIDAIANADVEEIERIILILMESSFKVPNQSKKTAYLIEKGVSGDRLCEIIAEAQRERQDGTQVLVARMNKNKKFQKEQLTAQGYEEFKQFYKDELKK